MRTERLVVNNPIRRKTVTGLRVYEKTPCESRSAFSLTRRDREFAPGSKAPRSQPSSNYISREISSQVVVVKGANESSRPARGGYFVPEWGANFERLVNGELLTKSPLLHGTP